ncbi:MAG: hypothetical protein OQJ84_05560 [Xanthomonadales bacterium]|nr:hypothetical protein [Xanthomonadales bacterium]
MKNTFFRLVTTAFLALFLTTACAEQGQEGNSTPQAATSGAVEETASMLDQPVDFSSPEAVEKTLQNIREQEGDVMLSKLTVAMDYLLYKDLSLGNDKKKLYKKLDGQTPNQIIARMKK